MMGINRVMRWSFRKVILWKETMGSFAEEQDSWDMDILGDAENSRYKD